MAIKATGHELKQFFSDPIFWAGETWHDYTEIDVNGEEFDGEEIDIPDTAKVIIRNGVVYATDDTASEICSTEQYFKRWKKAQTHVSIIVEIPRDHLPEFEAVMKANHWRILS